MANNPHHMDNLKPFVKGDPRRINKPKGARHISTWIQEMMNDESFETLLLDSRKGYIEFKGAPLRAIIQTATRLSIAGDSRWADWLARHGWKPELDITSAGQPISFNNGVPRPKDD